MDIVLFKDITAIENIEMLEREGKKYEGLYVDMNDKEQRRYVKDNAVLINDIIKKVDRSRIDQKKAFGISVEAEARAITDRLQAANAPFTQLIDAHKHERAEILAKQKAKDDAMAAALQLESDHEHGLLMNKVFDLGAKEREQERIDNEACIAFSAAQEATRQEKQRQANEAKGLEFKRLQREADEAHVSKVRSAAKVALMELGMDEMVAKTVVMAIHKGLIANVRISY